MRLAPRTYQLTVFLSLCQGWCNSPVLNPGPRIFIKMQQKKLFLCCIENSQKVDLQARRWDSRKMVSTLT